MAWRPVDKIRDVVVSINRLVLPFKRFGSKGMIAEKIVSLLPEHRAYVEVFGGTGAVLLVKNPSSVEVFNDIDNEVANFFRVLQTNPAELIIRCYFQPYSYADFRRYLNEPLPEDPVERAARFVFLSCTSFRFSDIGDDTFYVTIKKKPSLQWRSKVDRLIWVALRFRDVIVENRDFEEVMRIYDSSDTVFFCDPPYTQGEFAWAPSEHERLANCLRKIKGKFLLTIDDTPVAQEIYGCFPLITVIEHVNNASARNKSKTGYVKTIRNLVFANYEPPKEPAVEQPLLL